MKRVSKPVVLITGCASGIGLALARLLYRSEKFRVIATARSRSIQTLWEEFDESETFIIRAMDVCNLAQRNAVVEEAKARWGGVEILINNAGISYRAVVEHMTEEEEQNQFDVNYFGPVNLIRAVLPEMRLAGKGKIINVSSVSGMLAMPTMGSYSASKYALEGLSEALWYEVRPFGIQVSLIQPGFVHSRSFKNVKYSSQSSPDHDIEGLYADYYKYMTPFVERLMNLSFTTPESLARRILKVMRKPQPPLWIPATFDAKVFYYLRRFVPRSLLLELLFATLPRVRHWGEAYTHRKR